VDQAALKGITYDDNTSIQATDGVCCASTVQARGGEAYQIIDM